MRESIIALAKAGYNTQQINAILGSGTMANNHAHNMSATFNGGINAQLPASLAPQQPPAAPMAMTQQAPMAMPQQAPMAMSQQASAAPMAMPQQVSAAPMATPSQSVIDYIQTLNRNNTSFDLPPNTVTADSVLDNMLNESIGYNTIPDVQKGATNNG